MAETPNCNQVISACDQALADLQVSIAKRDKLLSDMKTQTAAAEAARKDAEEARDAWYHNPFILVPISILVGVGAGFAIHH